MKKSIFLLLLIVSSLFSNNTKLKKISLQLMWLDQYEFAGFYVAKEKGYYEDLGLDLQFKKFNFDTNITKTVLEGKADFGLNSSSLIIDNANGAKIKLIGAIFQSSPLALMSLKKSNINSIEDIKNKKIMLSKNQEFFATTQSLLASKNISLSDIQIIPHSFDVNDLITNKVDVMSIYTTNEPFRLKEKNYEVNIFHPKDYGFDFYEDILFTSEDFALKNPNIVEDFYKATLSGWYYALTHIDEVAQLVYEKYNPQNKSLKAIKYEAEEIKKLVFPSSGIFGEITEEKLKLIEHSYKIMGLLKKDINIKNLLFHKPKINQLNLLTSEKQYLNKKQKITMCIDPNWMPFEKIQDGKHIGISADYIKLIEEKINIPIELIKTTTWLESLELGKQRKCDIFSLVMPTQERKKYLNFTRPYLEIPLVLASNLETPFISDIAQVKDKKLGIVKGYAYGEILESEYPDINFVEVENINDGLKQVHENNIYGFIGTLATVGYHIQKNYIGQLKISGKFDKTWNLGIGTRNDEPKLNSILDKAIKLIPYEDHQEIINKWISVNYDKGFDYSSFSKVFFPSIAFIFVFVLIYRQYLLKRLNKQLNEKIQEEINKNNQQHRIMNQQAKMASMGEMIGNIAHQWRQPLSMISLTATGIKFKKEFDNLSNEEFNEAIDSINESAQFLSKTIDDFRNFYSDNKEKNTFYAKDIVNKALKLVSSYFTNQDITIIQNINNIKIHTIENELLQVMINILNNAKDALQHQEKERFIFIDIYEKNDSIIIEMKDNAGGIKDEILDKIFDPYFTTKHQSQGTGIGLYMSQQMVLNHMEGMLSVSNGYIHHNFAKYKGAKFIIELPIEKV